MTYSEFRHSVELIDLAYISACELVSAPDLKNLLRVEQENEIGRAVAALNETPVHDRGETKTLTLNDT